MENGSVAGMVVSSKILPELPPVRTSVRPEPQGTAIVSSERACISLGYWMMWHVWDVAAVLRPVYQILLTL